MTSSAQFAICSPQIPSNESRKESEKSVLQDLEWLGMAWDEGPEVGGDAGPYRQSERSQLYVDFANKLLDEGKVRLASLILFHYT